MHSCKKINAVLSALLLALLPALLAACKDKAENSKAHVLLSTVSPISADTAVTVPTAYSAQSATDIDTYIILNNENTTINGDGASFENSVLSISKGGSYSIKGKLSNGRIEVDPTEPNEKVTLYLSGVSVNSPDGAALFLSSSVRDAKLVLTESTWNDFSDYAAAYQSGTEDESDFFPAAIYSKSSLTVSGEGSLSVNASHGKGIFSSNDLSIEGGSLSIESADDAVCGKNGLVVSGGSLSVVSGGNGLCTGDSDFGEGALVVSGGSIKIESRLDCIKSASGITVSGGSFDLTSDGGSTGKANKSSAEAQTQSSLPGIKARIGEQRNKTIDAELAAVSAEKALVISGGEFAVNSSFDAFVCGGRLVMTGGNLDVKTDRTAFFSPISFTLSGGNIKTDYCLEGIEAKLSRITGGSIYINAQSFGLDPDMAVSQSGGTVVSLSASGGETGRGIYTVTGGTVFAAGSIPQRKVTVARSAELSSSAKTAANILLAVTDERGKALFCLKMPRKCEGFWFSSPELTKGKSYNVYSGGLNTGVQKNGIYQGSSYTPGNLQQTVTAR